VLVAWRAMRGTSPLFALAVLSCSHTPAAPCTSPGGSNASAAAEPSTSVSGPPKPDAAADANLDRTFAFVDVTVLPMDHEAAVAHQTVVVRDGRIASVSRSGVPLPSSVRWIDGRGRFLMPGMADMHAHIVFPPEIDDARGLLVWVANGVTTVRNMAGCPVVLTWRDRVARGGLLGPTIVTAGPVLDAAATEESGPTHLFLHSPAEVRNEVLAQKRAGYDFIKVYNGLTTPEYRAAVEAARESQMMVGGHIPRAPGLEGLAAMHEDSIDHAEEFTYTFLRGDDSDARVAAAVRLVKEAGITVTPTLVTYKTIMAQWTGKLGELLARPETRFVSRVVLLTTWAPDSNAYTTRKKIPSADQLAKSYRTQERLVLALQRAGVRLLVGTDAPVPVIVPGFSEREELQNLVSAGLTPYEALRAATANAAEFLKEEGEFGVVKEGARADLVLLDANPFNAVENVDRRVGVMVRGRWYPDQELRTMLDALATAYHGTGPRP
jgi:imidazolonepropionase-like amidohydrolase